VEDFAIGVFVEDAEAGSFFAGKFLHGVVVINLAGGNVPFW
jgi:hypothetical protein